MSRAESVASSAVKTALDINAKLIIVLSESGATAIQVAKYRPLVPIVVLTHSEQTARQIHGYVKGTRVEVISSDLSSEAALSSAITSYSGKGVLSTGDSVVFVYGQTEGQSGFTSTMRVATV